MLFGYYLRFLIINNFSLDSADIYNFRNFLKKNNKQMIEYFYLFLQKFYFIKILTDYNNKNEEFGKSINELSINDLLCLLKIDNLIKNENDDINFLDILNYLQKLFNSDAPFFQNIFGNNKIVDSLILNIRKNKKNKNLTKELIINFTPIKLEFIHLDNNIFDWIEKNLEKKCILCSKTTKFYYICLICGNTICHTESCDKYYDHIKKCTGETSIFIDMENMKISIFK